MKYVRITLMIGLLATPLSAGDKNYISRDGENFILVKHVIKMMNGKHDRGMMVGGRAGWLIKHRYIISGCLYVTVDDLVEAGRGPVGSSLLDFAYGGVMLGQLAYSEKFIHYSVGLFIGAGTINRKQTSESVERSSDNRDYFLIIEPEINLIISVSSELRTGLGLGYRVLTGLDKDQFSDSDIRGTSLNMIFSYGMF